MKLEAQPLSLPSPTEARPTLVGECVKDGFMSQAVFLF